MSQVTRSGVTGTGRPGLARVAAGGLGALWRDLNPSAGAPLAPLAGQRAPWLAWLPHLLVVAVAVALGAVAGGEAATDAGVPVRLAIEVLSGGMSGRLFTEVREKRGLCYSVWAGYSALKGQGSILG